MKDKRFTPFLNRNRILLATLIGFLLVFSLSTLAQEEIKAIRQTGSWPCPIDPAVGSDYVSAIALVNLYDSLVFPNPDGTVKPLLANSWVVSEDGLSYIFNLDPGARFHNGDELTAEDVAFSLERLMAIGEGFGYLFTTTVEGAKVLDKYRVQIILKQPFGPFLQVLERLYILNKAQVLANIQKEGTYGEFGDYGKAWLITNDAGSGPYKAIDVRTEEYLLMEKYDDYWLGWENKDAPKYVKLIGTCEAITVRTLLSRGELEITDQWQTSENLAKLEELPGTGIASLFEGSVFYIMLNTKTPPTDDIHFRKALAYCVDYEQIIDKIFPGCRPAIGPVSPGIPGHNSELKQYTLDLKKAEEELKKSSYYEKLNQYPVDIIYSADVPDEEKVGLMIQANAAKLGIKINVLKTQWGQIIEKLATPETTPPGSMIFVAPHYAEAGSILVSKYHSKSTGTWEQGEWLQDPEIDALIENALTIANDEERFRQYATIQEKLVEICPSLFILDQASKQAYRSDYIVFPAVEAIKEGGTCTPVMGYNFYYRDFKVFPEKAQGAYVSFKP